MQRMYVLCKCTRSVFFLCLFVNYCFLCLHGCSHLCAHMACMLHACVLRYTVLVMHWRNARCCMCMHPGLHTLIVLVMLQLLLAIVQMLPGAFRVHRQVLVVLRTAAGCKRWCQYREKCVVFARCFLKILVPYCLAAIMGSICELCVSGLNNKLMMGMNVMVCCFRTRETLTLTLSPLTLDSWRCCWLVKTPVSLVRLVRICWADGPETTRAAAAAAPEQQGNIVGKAVGVRYNCRRGVKFGPPSNGKLARA